MVSLFTGVISQRGMDEPDGIDSDRAEDPTLSPDDQSGPTWWLILAGLSSWSYIDMWAGNADELVGFSFTHFGFWTAVFFATGLLVHRTTLLALRGPRRSEQSYAAAAVALVLLQSWNTDLTASLSLGWRVVAWVGLTAVVMAITVRLAATFPYVRPIFGVLVVFLVGAHYLTALSEGWEGLRAEAIEATAATAAEIVERPDVYIVVLDEYTSGTVLRDEFNADISSFETALGAIGVTVIPDAQSNYTNTKLSVAGLLDGRFPATGGSGDRSFEELAEIHAGNNTLFASLDAAGYETHLFDNAWTFTRCGRSVDVCHTVFLDELDFLVAARTPLVDLVPAMQRFPWITGSLNQLDEATALARTPADAPRLVYLHALLPHAPLQLAPDCTFDLPGFGELGGVDDTPQARAAYVRQLECVNALLVDLAVAIPQDAIVILTGDHGVRWAGVDPAVEADASAADIATTLGILTAYRFPEVCSAPGSGASLMETTAQLFACVGVEVDGNPPYDAADSDRFFGASRVDEVVDITDRVARANE